MSYANFDDLFEAAVKRRFPELNRENINGASTSSSSSSSSSLIDLNNKTPTDSVTVAESENHRCSKPKLYNHEWLSLYISTEPSASMNDEDQRAKKGKSKIVYEEEEEEDNDKKRLFNIAHRRRFTKQNHGASTSSSSSLVDLNKIPTDSETEEESQRRNFEYLNGASTSSNPNYQSSSSSCLTESTSCKRRGAESKGGFKKAKVSSFPRMVRETPEWLVQVMRDMNGAQDLRLIFERTLSASDVKKEQSRLLIPFKKLHRNDFLTPEESLAVAKEEDNDEDDENIGVGIILVNERSGKWGLRFKIWEMKKKNNSGEGTSNYVLNWGWNDVVKGNGLQEGDYISLWSFRCRGVLCFALGTG